MLITELGVVTTLLLGAALGFGSCVVSGFWLQFFIKSDRWFWVLLGLIELAWVIGVCVLPCDWLDDNADVWGLPFMIIYIGSIAVTAIVHMIVNKRK